MVMQGREHSPLIFVVDDDTTIVRTIDGFLRRAGFRTESASDVRGALKEIRARRPDLILLDVNLPDGSGFDVCTTLSNEASAFTTPVLFISANEDTPTKVKGFEVGGVDYIPSPSWGPKFWRVCARTCG
jgi:DNA-binding response OmpR family regulator